MDVVEALLDSWDRQCRIVTAVASTVDEANRKVKPSDDGMPLDEQLAHLHLVRKYWLSQVAPERAAALGSTYTGGWGSPPIDNLVEIKSHLEASGVAVREAVRELIAARLEAKGGYDNPILFLQHMVWHDGWHVGLIMLGLRNAGQEPPEEWEEANIWGHWRTEEWS